MVPILHLRQEDEELKHGEAVVDLERGDEEKSPDAENVWYYTVGIYMYIYYLGSGFKHVLFSPPFLGK